MKTSITVAAVLAFLASQTLAEPQQCAGTRVAVEADNQHDVTLVCDAAAHAKTVFADCAMPELTQPTLIRITDDLPKGCFGLFHCETGMITVLSPGSIEEARDANSRLSHLSTDAFFKSIIVHELAHAATTGMPCPFKSCVVGPEYIAYLMQIRSLDPDALETFARQVDMQTPVSPESFNPFILVLAPDIFAQSVWVHHHQQDDPCGFVDALVHGDAVLDVEIFDVE